jgi:hypothetical protein
MTATKTGSADTGKADCLVINVDNLDFFNNKEHSGKVLRNGTGRTAWSFLNHGHRTIPRILSQQEDVKIPLDEVALVLKVMGKMFALTGLDSERFTVNLKCDPDYALKLRSNTKKLYPAGT